MINLRIVSNLAARSHQLRKLLDQMSYGQDLRVCLHGQTWIPQVDVFETSESFLILAEVPGLAAEDIEVVVDRNYIKLSGCRGQPSPSPYVRVHQSEISYGTFERAFRLPSPIRPEEAGARVEKGFLEIILPKDTSPRTLIEIR